MKPQSHINLLSTRELNQYQQFFTVALTTCIIALLFCVDGALAQTSSLQKTEGFVGTLQTAITGPIGKGISLIAIVALGFAAWSGRLTGALALKVIIGIVLINGAAEFLTIFTGVS